MYKENFLILQVLESSVNKIHRQSNWRFNSTISLVTLLCPRTVI
jgi:hypothetical protein